MTKECREIDQDISQVEPNLTEQDKGYIRTALMGSNMHKAAVADFNQDVDKVCTYCYEADGTTLHERWECKYFHGTRTELDKGLACIPMAYLPLTIQNGIAPAMRHDGQAT